MFIGREKFLKGILEYLNGSEKHLYSEYSPQKDFQACQELEQILRNSMDGIQSPELKLSLEIVHILLSHKSENVRTYALGKIFLLTNDEEIQEIIIKDLKIISNNKNKKVNEAKQYSLDLIASEVNKLEIIETILDILTRSMLRSKVEINRHIPSFIHSYSFFNQNSNLISNITSKNMILHNNNSFYKFLCKFRIINRQVERLFPPLEEIEDFCSENFIENEIIPYSSLQDLEYNKNDSLQELANFYAKTFKEKGHLRRLTALLDDQDSNIQQIGINALSDIIKFLMGSNYKNINQSHNFRKTQTVFVDKNSK